jgi:hypothetical protein
VTHLFRSGNPSTLVWLILYALGVKILFLTHPLPIITDAHEGFVYSSLIKLLQHQLHWGDSHFQWIALLLLLILALQLNQLLIRYHLLPGRNYYPAMSFLLLSTFQPAWNQLSAPMLATCFLLPALSIMLHPDQQAIKRPQLYHAGLTLGIATLISVPFSIFLILLWLMMLVNRPFRGAEWLLVLMGWLTPIYFYAVGSFLLDHFSWHMWKYPLSWRWQINGINQWTWMSLATLGFMFVIGLGIVWHHMTGMTIQVRKSWILLLYVGIIAIILILWNGLSSMATWLPLVAVIAAFASNLWWYLPAHRWVWAVNILHVLLILLAWAILYLPAHQPKIRLFPYNSHF